MDIIDGLLPTYLSFLAMVGWWLMLVWALMTPRELRRLRANEQMHVFLGATVVVLVLWMLRAGIDAGLNLHLLAVTALTLMFGARLAVLSVSAVLLFGAANGAIGWFALGLNFMIMGAAPIALTTAMLRIARLYLPANFFIYVFVNAFLCGGLSVVLSGGLSAALLSWFGPYTGAYLSEHYLNFYALMFFPEAVFNGMVMTLVIAYRPHWACSFTDELYLDRK